MKKKILLTLFVIVMCFGLVGCGQKEEDKNVNNDVKQDEVKTNNNSDNSNTQSEIPNNTTQNEAPDIELYSDDTKIVFKNDQGMAVYYYKGKEITGSHLYIDYGTEEAAKIALSVLNTEENETIESAHTEGKYLVIVYKKSTYDTLNVDTLRLVYSYLEEIKK